MVAGCQKRFCVTFAESNKAVNTLLRLYSGGCFACCLATLLLNDSALRLSRYGNTVICRSRPRPLCFLMWRKRMGGFFNLWYCYQKDFSENKHKNTLPICWERIESSVTLLYKHYKKDIFSVSVCRVELSRLLHKTFVWCWIWEEVLFSQNKFVLNFFRSVCQLRKNKCFVNSNRL